MAGQCPLRLGDADLVGKTTRTSLFYEVLSGGASSQEDVFDADRVEIKVSVKALGNVGEGDNCQLSTSPQFIFVHLNQLKVSIRPNRHVRYSVCSPANLLCISNYVGQLFTTLEQHPYCVEYRAEPAYFTPNAADAGYGGIAPDFGNCPMQERRIFEGAHALQCSTIVGDVNEHCNNIPPKHACDGSLTGKPFGLCYSTSVCHLLARKAALSFDLPPDSAYCEQGRYKCLPILENNEERQKLVVKDGQCLNRCNLKDEHWPSGQCIAFPTHAVKLRRTRTFGKRVAA